MMSQRSRLTVFIAELRRRRVVRAAAFYGGIAFVIIQIIDGAFSYLHIPEWFGTAIIILLLVGFPVAMVLAWAFDITEEGIVRAKGRPVDAKRKSQPLIGNKALALIALAAVLALIWGRIGGDGSNASLIRSIVVLPLVNLMGDEDQEYFVDGMTEALTNELSKLSGLKVISRTTAMRFKNSDKSIPEIAQELGVDAVVEGSVFKASNQVRITTQLIRGADDFHIWSEDYDRELKNVLNMHREVAKAIAGEIQLNLTPEEQHILDEIQEVNPEALDLYIRGRHLWNKRTGEDMLEALKLFKAALDIDPSYALAYSALAETYPLLADYSGMDRQQVNALGRAAANRVIEIDPTLAQPYAALGLMAKVADSAAIYFEKAIALNPNYATTYHWYSMEYASQGDSANALIAMLKAADLDPLSIVTQTNLIYYNAYFAEQYEAMLGKAEQLLILYPEAKIVKKAKGYALFLLNRIEEAEPWMMEGAGNKIDKLFSQALIAAEKGYADTAISNVLEMRFLGTSLNSPSVFRLTPIIWDIVAQPDSAFVDLNNWATGRDPDKFGVLYIDPFFKHLRLDPRFEVLLDKHRVEWARTHGGL